jgi:hypothetical protein
MAYNGYLLKAGNTEIPLSFIRYDTYTIQPRQRQDLDPYRDVNGVLHRNVVENMPSVIEFNTPTMDSDKLQDFLDIIRENYDDSKERKIHLTYYDMESDSYRSGDFYMAQPNFKIRQIIEGKILYDEMTINFIGY